MNPDVPSKINLPDTLVEREVAQIEAIQVVRPPENSNQVREATDSAFFAVNEWLGDSESVEDWLLAYDN